LGFHDFGELQKIGKLEKYEVAQGWNLKVYDVFCGPRFLSASNNHRAWLIPPCHLVPE
jgi:hypothetical protein